MSNKPLEKRDRFHTFEQHSKSSHTFRSPHYQVDLEVEGDPEHRKGTVEVRKLERKVKVTRSIMDETSEMVPGATLFKGSIEEFNELVDISHFARDNARVRPPQKR